MKMRKSVLSALILCMTMQAAAPAFAKSEGPRDLSRIFSGLSDEQTAESLSTLTLDEKNALLSTLEKMLEEDAIRLAYAQENLKEEEKVYIPLAAGTTIALGTSVLSYLLSRLIQGHSYRAGEIAVNVSLAAFLVAVTVGSFAKHERKGYVVTRDQVDKLLKKINKQRLLVAAVKEKLSVL
ncbi:hypothetical protein AZI86_14005 [Bdellovibrio bacteriovorus]|uniref:Uncharacterized protein n=1 Tax=Bdellovibrio bacteriovorus TaxID=959 RepID=A0A150WJX0_BDEBC|nr:hypothetical protein [Bdellovibrio bacteriovorus]KYG63923.1 hypothetical protein AZI86_14005 [Bdellovibrio bacteriovorus]